MVLNYTDANGKRRQPWIPTGLPAKGNKRRAEKLLLDTRKSFVPPVVSKENEDISSDMLFADYMELWLEIIRSSVEKTTFSSYTQMVKGKIAPYFRNTGLTLDGIQAKHIQSFYLHELKTVSPGTVIHYHAPCAWKRSTFRTPWPAMALKSPSCAPEISGGTAQR